MVGESCEFDAFEFFRGIDVKTTLEFNLPEEQADWVIHARALDLHAAVLEYAIWLRDVCKHGDPDQYNAEACREKLYEFFNNHGVSL